MWSLENITKSVDSWLNLQFSPTIAFLIEAVIIMVWSLDYLLF